MTTPTFQICIDAADPHLLNRFWAAATGYEVEDHEEQIRGLLAAGHITDDDTIAIDGHLAFKSAGACKDPAGVGPRLLFQLVPERKEVKNRVHLDLQRRLEPDAREAEVERLVGLGAMRLWDGQEGPHQWVTLADPEGNEFCVS